MVFWGGIVTNVNMLLSSLSMDLYRVAQAANRGSVATCRRFLTETNRWSNELEKMTLKPSVLKLINKTKQLQKYEVDQTLAEHALVYSILLKNQVIKN